jgi:hypothetical protein
MNWPLTLHYVGVVWQAVSTLIGVLIGASLTSLRGRREWIRDARKEEYRELIKELSMVQRKMMQLKDVGTIPHSSIFWELYSQSYGAFMSCLFIDVTHAEKSLANRWREITERFANTGDSAEFRKQFEFLRDEMIVSARKLVFGRYED